MKRHGYIIGGQVQGVGFRPFVYRAATRHGLTGHVGNTSDGVRVEVQGTDEALAAFAHALEHELSGLYDCAHGAGLAVILPAWMEYVMQHDIARFAQFAVRVWGCDMNFAHPETTARAGIDAFRAFLRQIGMPTSFGKKTSPLSSTNSTSDTTPSAPSSNSTATTAKTSTASPAGRQPRHSRIPGAMTAPVPLVHPFSREVLETG